MVFEWRMYIYVVTFIKNVYRLAWQKMSSEMNTWDKGKTKIRNELLLIRKDDSNVNNFSNTLANDWGKRSVKQ